MRLDRSGGQWLAGYPDPAGAALGPLLLNKPALLLQALAEAHPNPAPLLTADLSMSAKLLSDGGFATITGRHLSISEDGLRVWRRARYLLFTRHCLGVMEAERAERRRARGLAV